MSTNMLLLLPNVLISFATQYISFRDNAFPLSDPGRCQQAPSRDTQRISILPVSVPFLLCMLCFDAFNFLQSLCLSQITSQSKLFLSLLQIRTPFLSWLYQINIAHCNLFALFSKKTLISCTKDSIFKCKFILHCHHQLKGLCQHETSSLAPIPFPATYVSLKSAVFSIISASCETWSLSLHLVWLGDVFLLCGGTLAYLHSCGSSS